MRKPFRGILLASLLAAVVVPSAFYGYRKHREARSLARWHAENEAFEAEYIRNRDPNQRTDPASLIGDWFQGDHLGSDMFVSLTSDLRFSASLTGCMGTYGRAQGSWRIENERIVFTRSTKETGMRRELDLLDIDRLDDAIVLVDPNLRRAFVKYSAYPWTCYRRDSAEAKPVPPRSSVPSPGRAGPRE